VIALLPACASVSLNAPAPVPPAASALPGDAERYPAPRPRDPPAAPVESPAVSLAQAPPVAPPTAATPQPLPPPSEIAVAPTSAPAPVAAAPVAPAPVAPAASAAPALAAGHWSVQVGVFAVARNAENARARTAERLADAGIAGTSVRTVERDGRTYVVVGALPDRAGAQQLAARLRTVLQQDVVLFRW
jgi:cell division protein FtsN